MSVRTSNQKIALNTLFLYGRMIVLMAVNLYSVRLLWNLLGVDDYGIYNVVGGIVFMFAFLRSTMVATTQRFISFELGRGDDEKLSRTFSMSITVHALLAIIVAILAETIGLWFLNTRMNIPVERIGAANWVYQCSILSFLVTIICVPYNAAIVAHEHMKIYGYLGIMEGVLKLLIVMFTFVLPGDHLIVYAILVLIVSVSLQVMYSQYCNKHFSECKLRKVGDRQMMKDMLSFAGWSFLGSMGMSVRDQGLNIVLNLFFNVAVNAAKGIANQVGTTINGFASNFTMALNPQITKRYAAGDINSMVDLAYNGCKFSLILMSIVVIPIFFAAKPALEIWIGNVAPYTIGFLKLCLILSLIDCVVSPLTTSLQATGHIKKFQILISMIMISNIPMAWVWLKLELNPYIVMYSSIITSITALGTRLYLLKSLINFSIRKFLIKVYGRTVPHIILSSIVGWYTIKLIPSTLIGIVGYAFYMIIAIVIIVFLIALTGDERKWLILFIKAKGNF